MSRDLASLNAQRFDVLIVGGGIHGACTAWEAALRGLKVALIERQDFGAGTSCNSLRTLHGGLRYLQHLDIVRMRESIRERREWLRLAPHLCKPLRFVLPTSGMGIKGPYALRAALFANDVVSADRNQNVPAANHLPRGAIWSTSATRAFLAGTQVTGFNGAAAWYDGVCTDSERLLWEVVGAATTLGARAFNYVQADELLLDAGRVSGVRATDRLGGASCVIHAGVVVNAAGPWVDGWLPAQARGTHGRLFEASYAFNLLTRPFSFPDAVGLPVPRRARDTDAFLDKGTNTYFILPWNGAALVGTRHLRCDPATRNGRVPDIEVRNFLEELNAMLGEHRLRGEDIRGVYSGLLPEVPDTQGPEVVLDKSARILDHGVEHGLPGLLSVLGVKWTTSRLMGERAALKAAALLGKRLPAPAQRRLSGVRADWMQRVMQMDPALSQSLVGDMTVSGAQIVYAARHEMAHHLSDAVLRRQPLAQSRELDESTLLRAGRCMGSELQWSDARLRAEVDECLQDLQKFRGSFPRLP